VNIKGILFLWIAMRGMLRLLCYEVGRDYLIMGLVGSRFESRVVGPIGLLGKSWIRSIRLSQIASHVKFHNLSNDSQKPKKNLTKNPNRIPKKPSKITARKRRH
jgi:hypothetical protein